MYTVARCGHTHMKKEEKGTYVCVCLNINCLCCNMETAVDCVVVCGHDLFVNKCRNVVCMEFVYMLIIGS